jgi:hypothetical protein
MSTALGAYVVLYMSCLDESQSPERLNINAWETVLAGAATVAVTQARTFSSGGVILSTWLKAAYSITFRVTRCSPRRGVPQLFL